MDRAPDSCSNRPIRAHRTGDGRCATCAVHDFAVCGVREEGFTEKLQTILGVIRLEPKQILFLDHDELDYYFTVFDGLMSISKYMADGRRQIAGFLFPGDLLGISDQETYAYTAQAVITTELCRFPRRQFEALADEFPELERRLLHAVSNELIEAQRHMLLLGRQTAEERIAWFLLDLAQRAALRGEPDNPVFVPMVRADVADYLGVALETVSRTLATLHQKKLIEFSGAHHIHLTAPDRLRELVEGADLYREG